MPRSLVVALCAAAALALWAQSAFGTGARPTVADDPNQFTQSGAIDEGFQGFLQNDASNTHNVVAEDTGPDGKALFRSANVAPGGSGPIRGTEFLSVGSYDFFCSIHPSMRDSLPVSDNLGTDPVPRPDIEIKVKSKKLEKVVKSRKLKVRVEASGPTDALGIELKAKKGSKTIAKKGGIDVDGGDREKLKLKLKKKGVKALDDLNKAKVKVKGSVDFGSPDKAKKKLK